MLTLQEGHWYRGKFGCPRRIGWIKGVDVTYYPKDGLFHRTCCLATFRRWAVEDLGTEEPKE